MGLGYGWRTCGPTGRVNAVAARERRSAFARPDSHPFVWCYYVLFFSHEPRTVETLGKARTISVGPFLAPRILDIHARVTHGQKPPLPRTLGKTRTTADRPWTRQSAIRDALSEIRKSQKAQNLVRTV
jgi:hypothetical protein